MKEWSARVPQAAWDKIPANLQGGITRWVDNGIPAGHFLMSVLRNDLKGALDRADETSRYFLPNVVSFLYSYAPAACWGSEEKVQKWYESKNPRFSATRDNDRIVEDD